MELMHEVSLFHSWEKDYFMHLLGRYCYNLNFAVNRKGENVLEHSRTGSRTSTSGTGRVNSARGGENI
jgi:hypothetical protein